MEKKKKILDEIEKEYLGQKSGSVSLYPSHPVYLSELHMYIYSTPKYVSD